MDLGISPAPRFPYVWTDGSLVVDELTCIAPAGAGVFAHLSGSNGSIVGGGVGRCS